jgi:hypothetical protein
MPRTKPTAVRYVTSVYNFDGSLVVKKSTIPGAGKGLFANKDIEAKTVLGEFLGSVMAKEKFELLPESLRRKIDAYAFSVQGVYRPAQGYVLDPTDANGNYTPVPENVLPACNEPPPGAMPNVETCFSMPSDPRTEVTSLAQSVVFRTTVDVKEGEELFVSYGKRYDRSYHTGAETNATAYSLP